MTAVESRYAKATLGKTRLVFKILFLPFAFVACASFGVEDPPSAAKQAKGATNTVTDGPGSMDASTTQGDDAAGRDAEAGASSRALACGGAVCTTTGCCVTPQGASCTDACTSLYFQCFGAENCAAGQVCCATGKTTSCATTCAGTVVCASSDECATGMQCEPQSCGGTYAYSTCTAGTKPLNMPDCNLP